MTNNNDCEPLSFYAFPGLASTKIWISSKEKPSTALKLYNPSSLLGKAVKYFFSFLPTFLVHIILPRSCPSFASAVGILLSRYFKGDSFTTSYYLSIDGGDKKLTAQISSNDKIHAYAKISSDEKYTAYIKHESDALNLLNANSKLVKHVPTVLFVSEQDNYYILCQSAPQAKLTQRTLSFCKADADFLSLLAECYQKTIPLQKYVKGVEIHLPNDGTFSQLVRLKTWLISQSNPAITLVLAHGDYTPWNTYIIDSSIYAFDWECYLKYGPALYDVIHFLYMRAWLVDNAKPSDTVSKLSNLPGDIYFGNLIAHLRIDKSNILLYIGLYFYMHCYWKINTTRNIPTYINKCIDVLLTELSSEI